MKEEFKKFFVEQIQDLYSAEQQLIEALPKMSKACSSTKLRTAFDEHLKQTRTQAKRLEEILESLDEKPGRKKCKGMEGLIKEGEEVLKEDLEPEIRDAALICAAQKVEHYEIAGYGAVRTYAEMLGMDDTAEKLQMTLDVEASTDQKLTQLAMEGINKKAAK